MKFSNKFIAGSLAPVVAAFIFLVTLNMRPAITSVGPVIFEISSTFNMSPLALGMFGSLPLIMFATVASSSGFLATKLGLDRVLFLVLLSICTGILVRSFFGFPGLWIGAILATAAIAIANVLVPVVVRRDYAKQVPLATAIYSATMGLGAAVASAAVVPAASFYGWQTSLAIWAAPALLVAILWAPRAFFSTPQGAVESERVNAWKMPKAWLLGLFMGLQSGTFYFLITWLPAIEMSNGKTNAEAGMTLFWYQIFGLLAGLLIPLIMKSRTNQIPAALFASLPLVLGYLGMLIWPQISFVWVVCLGIGSGIALVVSLTLIAIRSKSSAETASVSGVVQSLGYLIAAITPVVAGAIMQAYNDWNIVLTVMLVVASLQTVIAVLVGKR